MLVEVIKKRLNQAGNALVKIKLEIIHTAVLPPGGRSRQNLDENIIGRNPDPHERVDMNGSSPFDIFENFNIIMFEDFFFAISQRFGS